MAQIAALYVCPVLVMLWETLVPRGMFSNYCKGPVLLKLLKCSLTKNVYTLNCVLQFFVGFFLSEVCVFHGGKAILGCVLFWVFVVLFCFCFLNQKSQTLEIPKSQYFGQFPFPSAKHIWVCS